MRLLWAAAGAAAAISAVLAGGAGRDILFGRGGDDHLIGDARDHQLDGGSGSTAFREFGSRSDLRPNDAA